MALDFKKKDPDDSVFPVKFEENSNLDMYGVWVKKRPGTEDAETHLPSTNELNNGKDNDGSDVVFLDDLEETIGFDQPDPLNSDMLDFGDFTDESFNLDEAPGSNNIISEETNKSLVEDENMIDTDDFETIDLDDFLATDDEVQTDSDDIETTPKKEDNTDNEISDFSFDMEDTITFEEDTGMDDIPEELPENFFSENSSADEDNDLTETSTTDGINMNITIDEDSDISSIAGESSNDDISIFNEPVKQKENFEKDLQDKDDDLVIESTIIEAGNIDEIREENIKILNQSSSAPKQEDKDDLSSFDAMLDDVMGTSTEEKNVFSDSSSDFENDIYFDDIEAVKDDLFEDTADEEPAPIQKKENHTPASVSSNPINNDKATEILLQIAGELASIKTELADLKNEMADRETKRIAELNNTTAQIKQITPAPSADKEQNGFFGEDDMDETIALTGDELNNILITADFTEETADDGFEIPEEEKSADLTEPETNSQNDFEIPPVDNFETDSSSEIFTSSEPSNEDNELKDIQPEHFNTATEDLSYLDDQSEIKDFPAEEEKITDDAAAYIDMPDFENEEIEEPDLKDFNMDIEEFSLPESQAIPDEEETENTSADQNDETTFDEEPYNNINQSEEYVQPFVQEQEPEIDISNTNETAGDIIEFTEEETDIFQNTDEEDVEENLSSEELDETTAEIPRFGFEIADMKDIEAEDAAINTETTDTEDIFISDDTMTEDADIQETEPEDTSAEIADEAQESGETIDFENTKAENMVHPAAEEEPVTEIQKQETDDVQKTQISGKETLPIHLKNEIKSVLSYMDQLLESLPENKIEEFAKSEYFDTYKRLFEELGIS